MRDLRTFLFNAHFFKGLSWRWWLCVFIAFKVVLTYKTVYERSFKSRISRLGDWQIVIGSSNDRITFTFKVKEFEGVIFLGYLTPKVKGTLVHQNVGNRFLVTYQNAWIFGSTAARTLNLVQWIFINVTPQIWCVTCCSIFLPHQCDFDGFIYRAVSRVVWSLSYEHRFIVAVIGRFMACVFRMLPRVCHVGCMILHLIVNLAGGLVVVFNFCDHQDYTSKCTDRVIATRGKKWPDCEELYGHRGA